LADHGRSESDHGNYTGIVGLIGPPEGNNSDLSHI